MSFKTSGFPHYSFNPLGFRTNGSLKKLLACGLDLFTTPTIDKVGKKTRDAERALALVGDTVTYIKEITLASQSFSYIDNTTGTVETDAFDVNGEFIIPSNGIASLTFTKSSQDYALVINERQEYGKIPFNITENNVAVGILLCQQYLSPATFSVETLLTKSDFDTFGGTVIEEQNLKAFEDGTIYNNSISQLDFATSDTGVVVKSFENVQSVPAGTVDNTVRYQAKGLSLANSVENGDFSDTSSWGSTYATFVVLDNSVTVLADAQEDRISQILNNSGGVGNTDIWVFIADIKSDSNLVSISHYGANAKYHSGSGKFETLLSLRTSWTSSSDDRIYVRDSRSSGWTEIQIKNVWAINLTQLGISNILTSAGYITTEQQEEAMFNIVRNLDAGTTDIQSAVVDYVSVGKNLFDKSKRTLSKGVSISDGILFNAESDDASDYIEVKEDTTYFASIDRYGAWYDSEKHFISYMTVSPFTSPQNAKYIRYTIAKTGIDTFQLELGSTATAYQPYRDSTLQLSTPLRSLPNGTRDEIKNAELINNKLVLLDRPEYIKRVSDDTSVTGVVAVNTTNYPLAKDTGSFINQLDAGGYETGIIGTDSTSGDGTLSYELAEPVTTYEDYLTYFDAERTIPIDVDTPVNCDKFGNLFAYNNAGEMPKAESIGSVKQNFVVCDVSGTPISAEFQSGNYIKIADDYFTESFDLNNILYDAGGDAKIIAYDDLANITNNQLFVSLDKQKIMFYEEELTGDCLYRACKALKLNEPYMVQTAEGSGEYEPYITADGQLYVLKEGVVVE